MNRTIKYYGDHAEELMERYEKAAPQSVHAAWAQLLPSTPGIALDVGAGSGRDAAWLASEGFEVIAVEPSTRLRELARKQHPSARIKWLDDTLPTLHKVYALDIKFDLILMSAVWMHIAPDDRGQAFSRFAGLLRPDSCLVISFREGPDDAARDMFPVSIDELLELAGSHNLKIKLEHTSADQMGRQEVQWTTTVFRSIG